QRDRVPFELRGVPLRVLASHLVLLPLEPHVPVSRCPRSRGRFNGRISKTLHILRLADEPAYRRKIKVQANLQEGRHALARKIFHGKAGQLYQRYQDGMEDEIGALGLVLNALVLFNTRYMDAAVQQLREDGFDVRDEDVARLSPFVRHHINIY
ncbi:Tn3 family transposase, partial [Streptomyces sp. Wh19]